MRNLISAQVADIPPCGVRRFFDIAATMKDIISLGIGEPDFVTPPPIVRAGIEYDPASELLITVGVSELKCFEPQGRSMLSRPSRSAG